jgi:hypothetical protein
MNAEAILSYVRQKRVVLIPDGDQINYKAPSGIMTPELAETIRKHRQEILGILTQDCENESTTSCAKPHDKRNILPGNCDSCPAAGFWDFIGPGKFCFHTAYFLGKSGKPIHCNSAQHNCPLRKQGQLLINQIQG